jgi:hypothetical protein
MSLCQTRSEAPLPCGLTHREVYSLLSREITPEAGLLWVQKNILIQASFLRSVSNNVHIHHCLHVLIYLIFEEMTPPIVAVIVSCSYLCCFGHFGLISQMRGVGWSWICWILMVQLSSTIVAFVRVLCAGLRDVVATWWNGSEEGKGHRGRDQWSPSSCLLWWVHGKTVSNLPDTLWKDGWCICIAMQPWVPQGMYLHMALQLSKDLSPVLYWTWK